MHWEYRTLLVELVLPKLLPRLVEQGAIVQSTAASFDATLWQRIVEVEDCPDDIDADVSTPVVFKIAAELSTLKGELVAPVVVAEAALDLLRRTNTAFAAPLFDYSLGGGGHLNAKRTPQFVPQFFAAADKRGAMVFYAAESLLVVPGAAEVARPLSARPLTVDWDHLLRQLQDAVGDEQAELQQLFDRCLKESSRNAPESVQLPKREALMVLAAAADPELSLTPFLLGLGGRQNVPWYLTRFLADAATFVASCEAALVTESHGDSSPLDFESLPERFHPLLLLLLRLRSRYLIAARRRRPDQLLGHLLFLVRAFYNCYNHPSVRALNPREIAPAQLPQVLCLTSLARDAIRHGVLLIESCCEKDGFRLHIGKCG